MRVCFFFLSVHREGFVPAPHRVMDVPQKLHLSFDIVVSVPRAYMKRILSRAHQLPCLSCSMLHLNFIRKKNKTKQGYFFFVNTRVGAAMTNKMKKEAKKKKKKGFNKYFFVVVTLASDSLIYLTVILGQSG